MTVNRYERDKKARDKAVEHHGCQCNVCGVDLVKIYGDIAEGFIHVHHLVPLSAIKEDYQLDQLMICCLCTLIAMRCCTDANHRLRRSS